jgi:mercuric ion transport protein
MPHVEPLVELIYFAGCPHVEPARAALRIALERAGRAPVWQEWDQTAPEAPAHAHGLGSPTILVDGRDVTGASTPTTGRACRADGVPDPEVIIAALAGPSAR